VPSTLHLASIAWTTAFQKSFGSTSFWLMFYRLTQWRAGDRIVTVPDLDGLGLHLDPIIELSQPV
jgi:hypothetical protein